MAGTDPSFDPNEFRSAIRTAMTMGLPTDSSQAVTFVWRVRNVYPVADPNRAPYSWDEPVTQNQSTPERTLQVPAAVEWGEGNLAGTPMGVFDTSAVTLTLLDEDYQQVAGADLFRINGVDYHIDVLAPPMGLFEVTVYQIHGRAEAGQLQAVATGDLGSGSEAGGTS